MRYLGGKHRQAKAIVDRIKQMTNKRRLVEPFCGGCSVTAAAVEAGFEVFASDIHPALITMWRMHQLGWRTPVRHCNEDLYQTSKSLPDTDPLKALIGFGASFSGKYFGGYARGAGRNFFDEACRSVEKKITTIGDRALFTCQSYEQVVVDRDSVIYADPPYKSTTDYSVTPNFDHSVFWNWCRFWADQGVLVFVTEFDVPSDSRIVHEFSRKITTNIGSSKLMVEKLVLFDKTR